MKEITVLYHIIYIIYDITYNFEGIVHVKQLRISWSDGSEYII